jgi:hypothetical protein
MAVMGLRFTTGITREDLARECLRELRLWPGCETVDAVAVLMNDNGKFTVHVSEYRLANKKTADLALGCIQREKARRFHLKI